MSRVGDDVWVFGYGSLIWRPSFPFAESRRALLRGWARRFWQGSIDHRGVPEAPGRVVTLIREAEARCEGTAFRIEREQVEAVMDHLDGRESGGYERVVEPLELDAPQGRVEGVVYVATAENPNYLGPAPLPEIAAQILRSVGPSGPNPEYLLRLGDALREIGADDPHVFELEALVREL